LAAVLVAPIRLVPVPSAIVPAGGQVKPMLLTLLEGAVGAKVVPGPAGPARRRAPKEDAAGTARDRAPARRGCLPTPALTGVWRGVGSRGADLRGVLGVVTLHEDGILTVFAGSLICQKKRWALSRSTPPGRYSKADGMTCCPSVASSMTPVMANPSVAPDED